MQFEEYDVIQKKFKMKISKKPFLIIATMFVTNVLIAQNMDKMNWLNEPSSWEVKDGKLKMKVTPESDYWGKRHYGFTVDD